MIAGNALNGGNGANIGKFRVTTRTKIKNKRYKKCEQKNRNKRRHSQNSSESPKKKVFTIYRINTYVVWYFHLSWFAQVQESSFVHLFSEESCLKNRLMQIHTIYDS